MKSIKLKAKEYLRENNITQYEYKSYVEGADFGANYVLETIEEVLQNPFQCTFETLKTNIEDVIEQLKK